MAHLLLLEITPVLGVLDHETLELIWNRHFEGMDLKILGN
jgi:hypothetical protein